MLVPKVSGVVAYHEQKQTSLIRLWRKVVRTAGAHGPSIRTRKVKIKYFPRREPRPLLAELSTKQPHRCASPTPLLGPMLMWAFKQEKGTADTEEEAEPVGVSGGTCRCRCDRRLLLTPPSCKQRLEGRGTRDHRHSLDITAAAAYAFGPLKAVLGAVAAIYRNYEVRSRPSAKSPSDKPAHRKQFKSGGRSRTSTHESIHWRRFSTHLRVTSDGARRRNGILR